jgi:ketosteroid isomerase-like protein/quercetin dioxygenase-like cupin family protein
MRTLPLFVLVSVVASSCARTVNVEQEKAALLAVDQEWSTTTKDLDKFVGYFAPEGTMALQGAPAIKGQNAIREMVGAMMKAPGFNITWKATRAEVAASGDLGYTVGAYELTMNNAAGMPATDKGKYVTTWKKIDGTWKVLDDIANSDAPTPVSSPHVVVPAAAVKWVDPPPSVPPGARLAVIAGDPSKPEMFTIRLQFPNGYRIAPHWHPTDEHVTVLSGTFAAAMGKTWDDKALANLPAGSYAVMSATMPHYATARGATVVQVHGMGPFVLNYVNPADDPSKQK